MHFDAFRARLTYDERCADWAHTESQRVELIFESHAALVVSQPTHGLLKLRQLLGIGARQMLNKASDTEHFILGAMDVRDEEGRASQRAAEQRLSPWPAVAKCRVDSPTTRKAGLPLL